MSLKTITLDKIVIKDNVRTDLTKGSIKNLVESVKQKGILQPILVTEKDGKFEIVAGHRRFTAAKECGLKEIPALVSNVEDADRLEYQITENFNREDLNPVDEAASYKELLEKYTIKDIVVITGKSEYRIRRVLSLMDLCADVKKEVGL